MGNKIPSRVYDTKGRVVDVAFSMRRNTKQPLDESSLPLSYDSLKEEMRTGTSSIYKGQIVVTQGPETIPEGENQSDYYTPFLIKNEGNSDVSYYADRIMTATYTDTFLGKEFVKKNQLGTTYTGVGKWPDATEDRGSLAYNEIFNDYTTYRITNNLKGEPPIMSHVEGKSNTLSGSFTHIEGYNNIGGSDFSHVEGANNNSSNNASYSHVEGESNSAINSSYSHIEGHSNQAISAESSHVGGTDSKALGNNAFVHGTNSVAFEDAIAIGKSTYAKAGFATGSNTSSYGVGAFATGSKTIANANYSVAEGEYTVSSGQGSHAEGKESKAYGKYSHAEGSSVTGSNTNTDLGSYSHAENKSTALGTYSHAENNAQIAETANYAHAEGSGKAMGSFSHVEGTNTVTTGTGGHAEGIETNAYEYSHAEGNFSYAKGTYAHAEGNTTMSAGIGTHAEGTYTSAYSIASHAEGGFSRANSNYSHVEGYKTYTTSNALGSHAEGNGSYTTAEYAHAEGVGTYASGSGSHTEGNVTHANGQYAHAEGNNSIAESTSSHAEGERTKAIGQSSHAEGVSNYAGGIGSHAEGNGTYANGVSSHSQGVSTYANGEGSFATGSNTTAQSGFSSSFGVSTYSNGIGSISEGNNTSSYGEFSHSSGVGTIARGSYSSTDGFYTVSKNNTEVGHGTYNRSYYSANGFLVENNDANKIPNEFARVGNRYLPGRYPEGQADPTTGTYFYDSSYETIFTIGNGGTGDTSKGPDPLYLEENGVDAGKYVKNNSRHNIMDIRKNGQMYYDGGMIVGGEVVAPMSYSYVASLGPTAYFTTIMAALLTQPEYYRPYLQYIFNGDWKNTPDGKEIHVEVGSTSKYSVQFYANRVAFNTPQHLDPIYGTSLGNMLGYSTGIKDIKYLYYDASKKLPSQQTVSNLTEIDLTFPFTTSSGGDYEGYLAGKVNLGKELAGGKKDTFAYNYKTANIYTGTYSSTDKVTVGLNCGTEDTYTIFKFQSYTFAGASQMYFQQLADKGTYIGAAGQKPLEKFNEETFNATGTVVVKAYYKFYYGNSDLDYSALESTFKNGQLPSGYKTGECTFQGGVGSTNEASLGIGAGGTMACWVAVPAGLYELTKYKSGQSGYMWYRNAMNAESALDTGLITDSVSSARPLYDFITEKTIGTCGLKYHVYIVYVPKQLTQGTWRFKIKRNAGHETDKLQTIPTPKLINKEKQVKLTFTANADTTVPVYYTKESFVNGTPDETISLKANERKTTTINKPEIYRFGVTQYDPNTLKFKRANTAITFAGVKGTVLDGYRLFGRATGLVDIDLTYLDTSKMTSMRTMFEECASLRILDVSNFDTSKVTDMSYMFFRCTGLTTLDVSNFDTSNVTNISYMFLGCSRLTTLDASNWNLSNITDISGMNSIFVSCPNLTTLNLSNWNTSNMTNMYDMFISCLSLTTLDLSNWDTSNVTNMYGMFYCCSSLTTLDLSNWDISNVTDMSNMFFSCSSLTTIGKVDTATGWQHKPTEYTEMFDNCPATPKPSWYKK